MCVLKQNKTTISHDADRFSEILAGYLLATFAICVVLMIVSCVIRFYILLKFLFLQPSYVLTLYYVRKIFKLEGMKYTKYQ